MSIHSRKFQEYVAKQDAFSSLEPIVFGGLLGINYSWGIGIVPPHFTFHYNYVTMGSMASQITSLTIVYSTFYSGADERKHQSSASLAFVSGIHRGPVNSPHKWPVTRKMFSFDVVIIFIVLIIHTYLSLYTHTHTHTHIYMHIYWGSELFRYCKFGDVFSVHIASYGIMNSVCQQLVAILYSETLLKAIYF